MEMQKLKVLSDQEIDMVHNNSVKILEEVGVIVESKLVLDILADSGCIVDYKEMKVKFPKKIIEKALLTVSPRIELYDRDGNPALVLGDGNVKCASGHNAVFMLSGSGKERRDSVINDVEEFAVVSDYLSEINIVGVPTTPNDVEAKTVLLYSVKALLENTKKPILFSSDNDYINKAIIEMDKLVIGNKSLKGCCNMISQISPTSPLFWEKGAVEALYVVAKENVPLTFIPEPITGVTAPYTLAGLLTLHNTEVLSGIIMAQIINPGTPVIYAAAWATYDMKLACVLIGRPESSILRVAGAQMAHFYNVPSHSISPDTDSNTLDEQNAWEKMMSIMAGISGNNDLIVNSGMMGTGMTISLEQLVIDNEMCKIARRFARGMEVNDDTIAFDVIKSVGPKGTYIIEDHTLEYLRSGEHAELDMVNPANYELWKTKGCKDVTENARNVLQGIFSKGNKCPLDEKIKAEMSEIIKKYEKMIS